MLNIYDLHSSPIFILLTCSIPVVSMHLINREGNIVDPDQMALSDISGLSRTKVH